MHVLKCYSFFDIFFDSKNAKSITKPIHEAQTFSRPRWALTSSAPWLFHETLKIGSFDPIGFLIWLIG